MHLIQQLDHLDFLAQLPDDSVDVTMWDPAWPHLEKHRKIGTTTRLTRSTKSGNRWFGVMGYERAMRIYPGGEDVPTESRMMACYRDELAEVFRELHRVMRAPSHLYVFSACLDATMDCSVARDVGFHAWNDLVWDKGLGMGYHYRRCHESVLFFEKRRGSGARPKGRQLRHKTQVRDLRPADNNEEVRALRVILRDVLLADEEGRISLVDGLEEEITGVLRPSAVQRFPAVRDRTSRKAREVGAEPTAYPTQKNLEHVRHLLHQSCRPGDLVLDVGGGSFTTALAARMEGCRFAGCDVAEAAVARGVKRMRDAGYGDPVWYYAEILCRPPGYLDPLLAAPGSCCG